MLSGQAIVVIGGGAIGSHFLAAAQALGARCAVIARGKPSAKVPYQRADVTSLDELSAAVEATFAGMGRVDTVIDVVGTHHKPMDLAKDDPAALLAEFDRVVRVNLHGAFAVTTVVAKHLVRQRHGHLIHLASNASRLSLYGSYAYNASKHGLEGLIKTAAAQLAPFGVRVNGLAPGTVETDLNRHLLRGGEGGQLTSRAASILAHTPTKRFATLDGITESLAALCVPQRHLTGNLVFCDDGYNIEGHSWPAGTEAVYGAEGALDELYARLEEQYPHG
jgi:NAD(P)-dependent dehydrogenase (short-subunit alcohol dehydrogenase family)